MEESRAGLTLYFMWPAFRSDFAKIKLIWFLQRVPIIWLFLTLVIIAAVLHSIYQSGGFQ
jgi:hypothetical protein